MEGMVFFFVTEKEYSKIVAKNLKRLSYEKGSTQQDIAKAIGVGRSTVACWLNGSRTPKMDSIDALCEYFGCVREDIMEEYDQYRKRPYYFDKETGDKAQELFSNPRMRILFDAARDSRPEDLQMAADLLERLKGTNNG